MRTFFFRRLSATLLVSLLALAAGPAPVAAQETQTLLIRDGNVYINGRMVDPDRLPRSLRTDGIEARYSFTGDFSPVFSIGRGLYRLSEGELVEVDPDAADGDRGGEDGVAVYFRGMDQAAPRARLAPANPAVPEVPSPELQLRMQALQAEAERFRRSARASAGVTEQLDHLMREFDAMIQQAPNAGAAYLADVREQNEQLYGQLMEEWKLDNRAIARAERIRGLDPGPRRDALREELRRDLDALFSLKQQNREREIEALRDEIARLEERLAARERLRAEIIEQRLRALIGEPREEDLRE